MSLINEWYCPMGCGQTMGLVDPEAGEVLCLNQDCPDDEALGKLMTEEQHVHLVYVQPGRFMVKHPLRERLSGIENCALHQYLDSRRSSPVPHFNRWYRAELAPSEVNGEEFWSFTPVVRAVAEERTGG